MTRYSLYFLSACCLLLLAIAIFIRAEMSLAFAQLSYTERQTKNYVEKSLPYVGSNLKRPQKIAIQFNTTLLSPSNLVAYVEGCVTRFEVNGAIYTDLFSGQCQKGAYKLPLSNALSVGQNTLTVKIKSKENTPAIFHLRPAAKDRATQIADISIVLFFSVLSFLLMTLLIPSQEIASLWLPFCIGIALRYLYCISTHANIRAHDVGGHLKNIFYIIFNGTIINPTSHNEAHQPPLYYILSALLAGTVRAYNASDELFKSTLQLLSFSSSALTLIILLLLAVHLFPGHIHSRARFAFSLIAATFPGLILASARINNDVLALLLGCWAIYRFFTWWDNPKKARLWVTIWVILALGLLTKLTVAVLLPVFLLCLLLNMRIRFQRKGSYIAASVVLLFVLTGWFIFFQSEYFLSQEGGFFSPKIDDKTLLTYHWSSFLQFSPIQILIHPFNNPWIDEARRSIFWEYLYRSAFFGEYQFVSEYLIGSKLLLVCGFLMLFITLSGWLRFLVRGDYFLLPMSCLLVLPLAIQIAYCHELPYAPHQDFRLNTFILIPLAYYFSSMTSTSRRVLAHFSSLLCILMSLLSCGLFIQIYLAPRATLFIE